jgi:hypothetical protein
LYLQRRLDSTDRAAAPAAAGKIAAWLLDLHVSRACAAASASAGEGEAVAATADLRAFLSDAWECLDPAAAR